MKILYHPQVSMRSYTEPPKWLLRSDAQLTKMRAYVDALPDDWSWYWLLPEPWQSEGWGGDANLETPPNLYSIPVPHMDNVLEDRFDFDMRVLSEVYGDIRPDVMLCEVPEHVRAWRAVQDRVGYSCPIVAMVEHVDFYDETKVAARVPFMLRQVDGAIAADKVVFPLDGMKREWLLNGAHATMYAHDGPKVAVWHGLFSPSEVDEHREAGLHLKRSLEHLYPGPIVFLISRLSDNDRTMYEDIIGASNDLLRQDHPHTLWVANPNEGKTWDWVRDNAEAYQVHPFGEKRLEREEYLRLLWAADVVPVMYDLSRIYSVGACEALTAECKLVTAQQKYGYGLGHYLAARERTAIAEGIHGLTTWQDKGVHQRVHVEQWHSVEKNVDRVKATLEELVGVVA